MCRWQIARSQTTQDVFRPCILFRAKGYAHADRRKHFAAAQATAIYRAKSLGKKVVTILEETKLTPTSLKLEITESAVQHAKNRPLIHHADDGKQ